MGILLRQNDHSIVAPIVLPQQNAHFIFTGFCGSKWRPQEGATMARLWRDYVGISSWALSPPSRGLFAALYFGSVFLFLSFFTSTSPLLTYFRPLSSFSSCRCAFSLKKNRLDQHTCRAFPFDSDCFLYFFTCPPVYTCGAVKKNIQDRIVILTICIL